MEGQQLLEEIRRQGLKPLVIAMTAFEGESLSAEAWELGVVAFLQKPFGMAELLEAIARGLLDTFYYG
ncbi:MAG: response regulator, partial [Candidatus Methylomirabilales bacterium]